MQKNNIFKTFISTYFDPAYDLRVQAFNLLGFAGVVTGLASAAISIFIDENMWHCALNLAASAFGFFMVQYARRTKRYTLCYLLTVIVVFIIIFPVLFFTGGGYLAGMPMFFIFATVFTSLMLEGKTRIISIFAEYILYTICFIAEYFYFDSIEQYSSEFDLMSSIFVSFVSVAFVLLVVIMLYIRIYNNQQKRLAEYDRLKTEFLANISHELKTPLTVMSSYAQISRKELAGVPGMEGVENNTRLISSEADRLALMVGQLLDVTRIEEGRMTMSIQPSSVMEIVQDMVSAYYPVFSKNNNTLSMTGIPDLPAVLCDAQRIMQVLVNLISNAARHTRDGKITISAEECGGRGALNAAQGTGTGIGDTGLISDSRSFYDTGDIAEYVKITVADTGEGIDAERLPGLFDRFRSGAEMKTRPGQETGTGLGLYICKYIVEAHGGNIGIDSAPGKGTSVWFTIPAGYTR